MIERNTLTIHSSTLNEYGRKKPKLISDSLAFDSKYSIKQKPKPWFSLCTAPVDLIRTFQNFKESSLSQSHWVDQQNLQMLNPPG